MSWRNAFFVLAAINLLMFGAAIGFAANGGLAVREGSVEGASMMHPRAALRALPPEARAPMRRALAQAWRDARAERDALHDAREASTRALAAAPYDADAVRRALARQRAASDGVAARLHDALAASISELSPEQRSALAESLRRRRGARDESDDAAAQHVDPAGLEQRELAPRERPSRDEMRERLREKLRERRERRRDN